LLLKMYNIITGVCIWQHLLRRRRPANMRHNTAVGVLCFFALEASLSLSAEVSEYRWVMSDNGDLLCGTSPPNKTLNAVKSRALCVWSCGEGCQLNSCETVNYWTNAKRCEHFYYLPCSYDVQQDCVNYKVTIWCTLYRNCSHVGQV